MVYGEQTVMGPLSEVLAELQAYGPALAGGTEDPEEKAKVETQFAQAIGFMQSLGIAGDQTVQVSVSGALGFDGNRLQVMVALV